MNITVKIPEKNDVNNIDFQKMAFIYSALENGWNIKKNGDKYIFIKNHEGKEEVYLDGYLQDFLETNISIEKNHFNQ
jgi:hypothetical protein